jgi:hypothetical protein
VAVSTPAAAPSRTDAAPAPNEPTTVRLPEDRSPRVRGADGGSGDGARPAPDAVGSVLPVELALGDILPVIPPVAAGAAAPDASRPDGPTPEGAAIADYGHGPRSQWPILAGMIVGLAFLALGGGVLWWRNRDSRYFPA